jgi:CIC family chloride channel protein
VFAPSLFIGATSGMAFGEIAHHALGAAAGQPALYAVIGMGAVFASAARAPLTSLASVVEMTGDFSLTLPVMLAVAIATAVSRGLSYSTIYTAKLLRRGTDIDRPAPSDVFRDMTVGDVMRPLSLPTAPDGTAGQAAGPDAALPGAVSHQHAPQVLLASESLEHALRQLMADGRDGLPVLADGSRRPQGWLTSQDVLRTLTGQVAAAEVAARRDQSAAGKGHPGQPDPPGDHPAPLPGYQILEVTIADGSSAAGRRLGETAWPAGWAPVSVQDSQTIRDAEPSIVLQPGDRVNLLSPQPGTDPGATPVRGS